MTESEMLMKFFSVNVNMKAKLEWNLSNAHYWIFTGLMAADLKVEEEVSSAGNQ